MPTELIVSQTRGLCLGLLIMLVATIGCGGGGDSSQIDISGQVTHKGQPVTDAMIYFEPDVGAGHNGPQGFARIIDGHYSTQSEGRGVVPGPHVVRIEEQPPTEGQPSRPMTFRGYETKADLTADSAEQDFEVPADAGRNNRRR